MDLPVTEAADGALQRFVCPFLDLANNDGTLPVCHAYERSSQSVVLLAGRAGVAGDEVCISYGDALDGATCLRLHGFVPADACVTVPLYAELQPGAEGFVAKAALLTAAGVQAGVQHLLSLTEPLPGKLMAALRAMHLGPEEAVSLAAAAARSDAAPLLSRVSHANEVAALATLRGALGEMLSAYATSALEDDVQLRAAASSAVPLPGRLAAALTLRLAEKRVLAAALAALDEAEEAEVTAEADRLAAQAGAKPLTAFFEALLAEGGTNKLDNELD